MELTIQTFLIVCPLVFLAGLVDSIAGGGGLISLPAYLLAGVPMHNAIATNKLSSATGTAISTARLCKNKFVDWGVALPCISMALVGSFAGAHIALLASDKILKWMLIPVLPIVAFYVMKKKNLDDNSNVEISRKKQWILCAVCSLAVGCYDGFYGPGTGTFLLILYTGVAKLPVAKASGTMKLANLSTADRVRRIASRMSGSSLSGVRRFQQMGRLLSRKGWVEESAGEGRAAERKRRRRWKNCLGNRIAAILPEALSPFKPCAFRVCIRGKTGPRS